MPLLSRVGRFLRRPGYHGQLGRGLRGVLPAVGRHGRARRRSVARTRLAGAVTAAVQRPSGPRTRIQLASNSGAVAVPADVDTVGHDGDQMLEPGGAGPSRSGPPGETPTDHWCNATPRNWWHGC